MKPFQTLVGVLQFGKDVYDLFGCDEALDFALLEQAHKGFPLLPAILGHSHPRTPGCVRAIPAASRLREDETDAPLQVESGSSVFSAAIRGSTAASG